ncbi:uncharacterized protein [Linepithema humile]|uniref:uncharacterized protein n=1 Tax=Linepithema humile TaxID=83485 RepID=UPI00351F711F
MLKEHHVLTTQNSLYEKPDGFPLTTIEDFQELETDKDRLQKLASYLKFIGGIKLREALSHFQKETMTDELTSMFTYWGRKKHSLAFYNTQTAKVFFYAAKMCPNFEGPLTRTAFKLEMMEVFRAAKQRHYLKSKVKTSAAILETETSYSDIFPEAVFDENVPDEDTADTSEMEDDVSESN